MSLEEELNDMHLLRLAGADDESSAGCNQV